MLHRFRCFLLVFIGVIAGINHNLAAAPIVQVTLPIIETQQEDALDILLAEGLAKVLVRLTGNPDIAKNPKVVELLKKPRDYLENYQQQTEPAELLIAFDQVGIEQALNNLAIPYWGSLRPTITIWWLMEAEQTVTLVDSAQYPAELIEQKASQQGFSVILPLADLAEQALVDKAIFNEVSANTLRQVSEKYLGNAILAVAATEQQEKYLLQWRLWLTATDKQPLAQGTIEGATLAIATEQLFSMINPLLAKVYLIKAENTQQIDITVKNIDFNGYVKVSKVMALFDGKLIETSGSIVRYQVTADPRQVKAQMSLINLQEEAANEEANHLIFKP